jgi:hypothetical protein
MNFLKKFLKLFGVHIIYGKIKQIYGKIKQFVLLIKKYIIDYDSFYKDCFYYNKYKNIHQKDPCFYANKYGLVGQNAHDYIYNMLNKTYDDKEGFLIGRFGATELRCIYNSVNRKLIIKKKIDFPNNFMLYYSGFFTATSSEEELKKYIEDNLKLMENIDVLAQFNLYEFFFKKKLKNAKIIDLTDLEPFYVEKPWIRYLEGKKVLVIHPFKETILYQLSRKDLWLRKKEWLPDCSIEIIKAVQSLAGNKPEEFDRWYDALQYMKNEIDKHEFDIALIGCGAYGILLGDYIKSLNKQAVVMGGATQLLFGIKGRRWEIDLGNYYTNNVFNEYWINPLDSNKIKNYKTIEDGCYW